MCDGLYHKSVTHTADRWSDSYFWCSSNLNFIVIDRGAQASVIHWGGSHGSHGSIHTGKRGNQQWKLLKVNFFFISLWWRTAVMFPVYVHFYMTMCFHVRHLLCSMVFTGVEKHGGLCTQEPMWLLLLLLCLGTLIATAHGNILRWMMRCWSWKIPCNNACGCRCHVSDNVWAEAYFLFNTGMPTLAPTEPPFELHNERNKPSLRLGFEVLLKSLRFSPCGPLSAALNKRGFVRSATEALVKLVGQAFLCWIGGGLSSACNKLLHLPSHTVTHRLSF